MLIMWYPIKFKKIGFIPDGNFTFEGSLINWYFLKNKA